MTPEQKVEELKNSLGAIAECISMFHENLTTVGFGQAEALVLTVEFLKAMVSNAK